MKLLRFSIVPLILTLLLSSIPTTRLLSVRTIEPRVSAAPTSGFQQREMAHVLRSASPMFIENVGQFAPGARFQMREDGRIIWLAGDGLWVTIYERTSEDAGRSGRMHLGTSTIQPSRGVNLKLSFVDANPHVRLEPFDRLDTHVSYFIGSDSSQWHKDVPVWGGVRYANLYPGVDLELTNRNGQMVQRLVARSGADLNAVRLRVEGAETVTLDGDILQLTTAAGNLSLPLLQVVSADGTSLEPKIARRTASGTEIAAPFAVHPPTRTDEYGSQVMSTANHPDAAYSTFLGGSNWDHGMGIAVDDSKAAYVTGYIQSTDFPTTTGAYQDAFQGGAFDAFALKLEPGGGGLAYATYLGGDDDDGAEAIAVDATGNAYVTGWTYSPWFPTTSGAYSETYQGGSDAFVVKLSPTGSDLTYGTFLGGGGGDGGYGIAVDAAGNAYVTGATTSPDLPKTPGAYDTTCGSDGDCDYDGSWYYEDAFVVKLNPAGGGSSDLLYATFLGHGHQEWAEAIALDDDGDAFVTGYTYSADFPTTAGAYDDQCGSDGNCDSTLTDLNGDAFVARLHPAGSGTGDLLYATFLGGSDDDEGHAIYVIDTAPQWFDAIYVAGRTYSSDFPTTYGAYDESHNGEWDAFAVKIDAAASLRYATYLGGSDDDEAYAIVVDGLGAAYTAGWTGSVNFPTTPYALDGDFNGWVDAFVTQIEPSGHALRYSTFLGGSNGADGVEAVALDGNGAVYVTGDTDADDFPTTSWAYDPIHNGGLDGFVAKLMPRWHTFVNEDFEGVFPSGLQRASNAASWEIYGNPSWGKDDCRPYNGSYSAWIASGGTAGIDPCAPSDYPDSVSTWMVYGPVDLSGASDAELIFAYWNNSSAEDHFYWLASTNPRNIGDGEWYGGEGSTNSGGWETINFDLTNVPTLGDLTGEDEVWIAFHFKSDPGGAGQGAFVDDVVLRALMEPSQVYLPLVLRNV